MSGIDILLSPYSPVVYYMEPTGYTIAGIRWATGSLDELYRFRSEKVFYDHVGVIQKGFMPEPPIWRNEAESIPAPERRSLVEYMLLYGVRIRIEPPFGYYGDYGGGGLGF